MSTLGPETTVPRPNSGLLHFLAAVQGADGSQTEGPVDDSAPEV